MMFIFLMVLVIIAAVSFGIGLFLFLKPASAIELQKKFYQLINWKIEPISWNKEIRNTWAMGLFLIIVALSIVFIIFFRSLRP